MSLDPWLKVTRPDDGETVGYLEPLSADYSEVQPRNLLGHPVGAPSDFMDGEDRLVDRGIGELAGRWHLRDAGADLASGVVILEVSPDGIVVSHADLAKAGAFGRRVTVPWPDLAGTLGPAEGGGA